MSHPTAWSEVCVCVPVCVNVRSELHSLMLHCLSGSEGLIHK